ncbi:hypothetical protein BGZ76_010905 [Entomortierella beljakovae]|nr:hypothetical protein BGZ76_010905 [Entomortierella beljakovae]
MTSSGEIMGIDQTTGQWEPRPFVPPETNPSERRNPQLIPEVRNPHEPIFYHVAFFVPTKQNKTKQTNMSDHLHNTANSYLGDLQQTIGEKIGSPEMAAAGAAQKSQADAAQTVANAETKAQAAGRTVMGHAQQKIGSETGDIGMQLKGITNQALGDVQKNL